MSDSERSMRDGADPAEGEMSEDDMQAYNDSEYSDFANEEDCLLYTSPSPRD